MTWAEKRKDIKWYWWDYAISNKGRVKSFKRYWGWKLLKIQYWKTRWYPVVSLSKHNYWKKHIVSRLVAIHFIKNEENKPQVNHIDGDKTNNTVDNLEWVTNSENQIHAYKNWLKSPSFWDANPKSKNIIQYDKNGNFVKERWAIITASKELNIPSSDICMCCKKTKCKSAGWFIWRYKWDDEGVENLAKWLWQKWANNWNSKKVVQKDLDWKMIKVRDYIGKAAKVLWISASAIWSCCKWRYKTSWGFKRDYFKK